MLIHKKLFSFYIAFVQKIPGMGEGFIFNFISLTFTSHNLDV